MAAERMATVRKANTYDVYGAVRADDHHRIQKWIIPSLFRWIILIIAILAQLPSINQEKNLNIQEKYQLQQVIVGQEHLLQDGVVTNGQPCFVEQEIEQWTTAHHEQ